MSEIVAGGRPITPSALHHQRVPPDPEAALRAIQMGDAVRARAIAAGIMARMALAAPDPRVQALLAFDLICRARRLVWPAGEGARTEIQAQAAIGETLLRGADSGELHETFLRFWDHLARRADRSRRPAHPAVDLARVHIRKHYVSKLSLADIAQVAQVSRNYLSHLFRKHCGVTVVGFIHQIRMKQAVRLMTRSDVKVAEVARRVGYTTYRDFHRNFVRLHDAPPRRYRLSRMASETAGPE